MPTNQRGPAAPKWTAKKETAATLVAEDQESDQGIADLVGISRTQLIRWKADSDFIDRVKVITQRLGDLSLRHAIARRHKRVGQLQDRWERMQRVIQERAEDGGSGVPGDKTGLLVKTIKQLGGGESAREVEEYEVDTGLLKEMRELEKQAAQELGQWTEKREIGGPNGGPQVVTVLGMSMAEFDKLDPAEKVALLRSGVTPDA